MIAVQGPVLALVSRRFSDRALMAAGAILLACGFTVLMTTRLDQIYFGALLIALGNGLLWPTFMSVLSKSAGERLQGAVQGFASSAGAVASILGLLLGGLTFLRLGIATFAVAALIIVLVAAITLFITPSRPTTIE